MENVAESVKTPKEKVVVRTLYTEVIEANPERIYEIKMWLRTNGVSDQVLYNWGIGRSKLNLMQATLIKRMIGELNLKTGL